MDIKKYKELADSLFESDIPAAEGVLRLNAFDPKDLVLFIEGQKVYGYTPDIKFTGTPEEFEINLHFTSPWAFAFLENKGKTVEVNMGYKTYGFCKYNMRINSGLKFQHEVPTVNVKFKKV